MTTDELSRFIELLPDLACIKSLDGVYTHCNHKFLDIFHKKREEVIGKTDFELFGHEDALQFSNDDKLMLENCTDQIFDASVEIRQDEIHHFHATKELIYDHNGKATAYFCIARDISLEKQYEFIYEDSQAILEYIATEHELQKVLDKIIEYAERRSKSSLCSVLLLDEKKQHLFNGSAPSLPEFYNQAIEGIEIGEKIGSCGSAAYTRKRVIVKDIDAHENWQPYLSLTQKANLHACWSEPIISSENEILGTFAIYHTEPKTPSNFELKLIHSFAHLASVAIEKQYKDNFIKQKEREVIEREDELSKIFNNALVGLMYITAERVLVKGNQHLANILGYDSPEEMVGISMRQLHLSQERFVEFGKKNFEPLRENKEAFNIEYQLRKKDGSATWCLLSGKTIDDSTPADMNKGVLWTIQDINKRKKLEEQVKEHTKEIQEKNSQLEELALRDHLTNLYNRSKIDATLEYQINHAQRYGSSFGVIMLDIDFFKEVNDTYGHQTGDQILQEFAQILQGNSRVTDTVGRWGGEEFLIIVENISETDLLHLADKIRQTIEAYKFTVVGHKTASLGVTLYKTGDKVHQTIERADKALYNAKTSGRNCVKIEK